MHAPIYFLWGEMMKIILESIEEINEFIENWNGTVYKPIIDEDVLETSIGDMPVTYRQYPPSIIKQIPKGIIEVKPNGVLIKEKGLCKAYDMYTLLDLKELIPNSKKYKTLKDIAKKVGMKYTSCCYLCAGIELGMFDHLYSQWENLSIKYDKQGQLI